MKKIVSLLMLTFSIFVLVACSNKPSKEAMNEELKKPEVIAIIEESLKNLDKEKTDVQVSFFIKYF